MSQEVLGSARVTGEKLVEALFPAGRVLPAGDVPRILGVVEKWLGGSAVASTVFRGLLTWLEWQSLASMGSRFSSAPVEHRRDLLERHAESLVVGGLLRALAAPFKTAWLLDDDNLAALRAPNRVRVPSALEAQRWRSQVVSAADVDGDQEIEAHAVVVGTGAGGAAAALELAARGLGVVMVEEGAFHDRRHFNGRLAEVIPLLYRSAGLTASVGNTMIPIPIGRGVGGTTTINSGTCLRTPARVLAEWRAAGLGDFTDDAMRPLFEEVERVIGVQAADPRYVGEIGRVIGAGAAATGFRQAGPLLRNAVGCDGQGLCQFGCPTDAKQSTNVSYVPRALTAGAFLYTGFRVDEFLRTGDAVTGIRATGRRADGSSVTLKVSATATVVSAGSLMAPALLKRAGVRSRWLGRNLSIHPAGVVTADFPERFFDHSASIPQGYGVHDLDDEDLVFEGGTVPWAGHGHLGALYGHTYVEFAERYQQTAYFGFMIRDQSRGRVLPGVHRDLPLVAYSMNERDFSLFKRGIHELARMYLAAGAERVHVPGLAGVATLRSEAELRSFLAGEPSPRDFLVSAYHPLGTARISARREDGVCDPEHRVWDVPGLYVMDGCSVPSSLGANPQVTIMAMATRAARLLAERLAR